MFTRPIPPKQPMIPGSHVINGFDNCAGNRNDAMRQIRPLWHMEPILTESQKSDSTYIAYTMQDLPRIAHEFTALGRVSAACRPSFEAFWAACAGPR